MVGNVSAETSVGSVAPLACVTFGKSDLECDKQTHRVISFAFLTQSL